VTVPIGTRVVLGFDAGDPARPVAALWEAGGTATQIAINGSSTKAARDGEAVNASAALSAWFTQVQLATGVAPPSGAIGAVSGGSDVVRIP
jgi:CBS-domain-containing membrane protein